MQHATHHAPTRTIGIREAARALGKSPSTLSRYIAANPVLNHGTAGRPKVDLDELRRHREANVNPLQIGSHAGLVFGEIDGATNGHADILLAVEYDRAYNAGKELQKNLIDLAALLGQQLATMPDPREIVTMLEKEYGRLLTDLAADLRSDVEADAEAEEARASATGDVAPLHEPQR